MKLVISLKCRVIIRCLEMSLINRDVFLITRKDWFEEDLDMTEEKKDFGLIA
jgi:hypothetical protein